MLTAASSLLPFGTVFAPVLVFVALLASVLMQVYFQPYLHRHDNYLATVLHISLLILYLIVLLGQTYGSATDLFDWVYFLTVMLIVTVLGWRFFRKMVRRMLAWCRSRGDGTTTTTTTSLYTKGPGSGLVSLEEDEAEYEFSVDSPSSPSNRGASVHSRHEHIKTVYAQASANAGLGSLLGRSSAVSGSDDGANSAPRSAGLLQRIARSWSRRDTADLPSAELGRRGRRMTWTKPFQSPLVVDEDSPVDGDASSGHRSAPATVTRSTMPRVGTDLSPLVEPQIPPPSLTEFSLSLASSEPDE